MYSLKKFLFSVIAFLVAAYVAYRTQGSDPIFPLLTYIIVYVVIHRVGFKRFPFSKEKADH